MSQPDILKLTRDVLAECEDDALDKVDKVAEALSNLAESLVPVKSVKARMLVMVLRQCVTDERKNRESPK